MIEPTVRHVCSLLQSQQYDAVENGWEIYKSALDNIHVR